MRTEDISIEDLRNKRPQYREDIFLSLFFFVSVRIQKTSFVRIQNTLV
jgi:hypothetical protein